MKIKCCCQTSNLYSNATTIFILNIKKQIFSIISSIHSLNYSLSRWILTKTYSLTLFVTTKKYFFVIQIWVFRLSELLIVNRHSFHCKILTILKVFHYRINTFRQSFLFSKVFLHCTELYLYLFIPSKNCKHIHTIVDIMMKYHWRWVQIWWEENSENDYGHKNLT